MESEIPYHPIQDHSVLIPFPHNLGVFTNTAFSDSGGRWKLTGIDTHTKESISIFISHLMFIDQFFIFFEDTFQNKLIRDCFISWLGERRAYTMNDSHDVFFPSTSPKPIQPQYLKWSSGYSLTPLTIGTVLHPRDIVIIPHSPVDGCPPIPWLAMVNRITSPSSWEPVQNEEMKRMEFKEKAGLSDVQCTKQCELNSLSHDSPLVNRSHDVVRYWGHQLALMIHPFNKSGKVTLCCLTGARGSGKSKFGAASPFSLIRNPEYASRVIAEAVSVLPSQLKSNAAVSDLVTRALDVLVHIIRSKRHVCVSVDQLPTDMGESTSRSLCRGITSVVSLFLTPDVDQQQSLESIAKGYRCGEASLLRTSSWRTLSDDTALGELTAIRRAFGLNAPPCLPLLLFADEITNGTGIVLFPQALLLAINGLALFTFAGLRQNSLDQAMQVSTLIMKPFKMEPLIEARHLLEFMYTHPKFVSCFGEAPPVIDTGHAVATMLRSGGNPRYLGVLIDCYCTEKRWLVGYELQAELEKEFGKSASMIYSGRPSPFTLISCVGLPLLDTDCVKEDLHNTCLVGEIDYTRHIITSHFFKDYTRGTDYYQIIVPPPKYSTTPSHTELSSVCSLLSQAIDALSKIRKSDAYGRCVEKAVTVLLNTRLYVLAKYITYQGDLTLSRLIGAVPLGLQQVLPGRVVDTMTFLESIRIVVDSFLTFESLPTWSQDESLGSSPFVNNHGCLMNSPNAESWDLRSLIPQAGDTLYDIRWDLKTHCLDLSNMMKQYGTCLRNSLDPSSLGDKPDLIVSLRTGVSADQAMELVETVRALSPEQLIGYRRRCCASLSVPIPDDSWLMIPHLLVTRESLGFIMRAIIDTGEISRGVCEYVTSRIHALGDKPLVRRFGHALFQILQRFPRLNASLAIDYGSIESQLIPSDLKGFYLDNKTTIDGLIADYIQRMQ
eukprot:gnl/Dysnectes_brevis/1661_a1890_1356.p1 GENE.gnl/Dysnectes_brevis/1661_a1890_1356~~gnl/Dysnectes_brevis/1661_a1890_1356.p1  ORF type:complete len:989 (-),score=93.93 gnl/Dysnectes_brevis/1661_a1890_1356:69-2906(-)